MTILKSKIFENNLVETEIGIPKIKWNEIPINKNKNTKNLGIKIVDKNMREHARGLSSFNSDEILRIKGHHSSKISEILGYVSKSEVIHKDDMVEI